MYKVVVVLVLLCAPAFSGATIYQMNPDVGEVSFLARGRPTFIAINGKGEGLNGQLKNENGFVSGEISFRLETLQTGIALRDEHLKNKYLHIGQFPLAILKINQLKMPEFGKSFTFEGSLSLHGVEKKIEGVASVETSENKNELKAKFPIKLSMFDIEIPSFQGITVAEDVEVVIDVPLTTLAAQQADDINQPMGSTGKLLSKEEE